jgi:hypothetical protein
MNLLMTACRAVSSTSSSKGISCRVNSWLRMESGANPTIGILSTYEVGS